MSEPYQQPNQPYPYPPQPQGYAPQQLYGANAYAPQAYGNPQAKLPGIVIAASIMWIIYGSLALIGNLLGLAAGGRPGASTAIGFGIAAAFLISGIQALGGKARGLLASGICSIVLGALTSVAFLLLGALIRGFRPPGWLLGFGFLIGAILITAGILACIGNRSYKEWRAAKGLY
jgi:hypothetical protein